MREGSVLHIHTRLLPTSPAKFTQDKERGNILLSVTLDGMIHLAFVRDDVLNKSTCGLSLFLSYVRSFLERDRKRKQFCRAYIHTHTHILFHRKVHLMHAYIPICKLHTIRRFVLLRPLAELLSMAPP